MDKTEIKADLINILYDCNGTGSGAEDVADYIEDLLLKSEKRKSIRTKIEIIEMSCFGKCLVKFHEVALRPDREMMFWHGFNKIRDKYIEQLEEMQIERHK